MKTKVKKLLVSAVALALTGTMGASIVLAEPMKGMQQTASVKAASNIKDVTDRFGSKLSMSEFIDSDKIPEATAALNVRNDGKARLIVQLEEDSLIDKYLSDTMLQTSYESFTQYVNASAGKTYAAVLGKEQTSFIKALKKTTVSYKLRHSYSSVFNGVSIEVDADDVSKIEKMSGVKSVIYSERYNIPTVEATENIVDVYDTGIYKAEGVNYQGDGMLVAVLDTGFDVNHPAFSTMPEVEKVTKEDVAAVFDNLEASKYEDVDVDVDDVYYNAKVPFAFDYANKDADTFAISSSHGVHVAGIIVGQDDTVDATDGKAFKEGEKFRGVAPNAQLMVGKVFADTDDGEDNGAETDDILAAVADCVTVGADVINMSLGTSCGFSREEDGSAINAVYDKVYAAGINLVVAASNSYSSSMGSKFGSTNLTSNPDSATVGSPSTYVGALSVASISGQKSPYMLLDTGAAVYFNESSNAAGVRGKFVEELLNGETRRTLNYVVVPGYGKAMNYTPEVKEKLAAGNCIAVVSRGDISFEDKQKFAYENGAVACIIYNNVSGKISATLGTGKKIPTCTVTADIGAAFKINMSGTITLDNNLKAGPFMSDFSSWGPTPDLKIKPEITAHGGDITSAVVGGYDQYSGTSMASPNMAGAVTLLRQHVAENYGLSGLALANRVNQLLMSTATIVYDEFGLPYSIRKQGAGLGDIGKAISTDAYIYVENNDKPKLELGDDPARTGVYTMNFHVSNTSDHKKTYTMDVLAMTECLSIDGITVAEKAYILDQAQKYFRVNGKASGKTLTLEAGEDAKVSVTLTLSAAEKKYLEDNFKNGMYVEGYVMLKDSDGEAGVDLSIPYLAFYGDWTDAPIFDYSAYEVSEDYYNASIPEEEKRVAALYESIAIGRYYKEHEDIFMPLGEYIYLMPNEADSGVVSSVDKISVGNSDYGIYEFYAMYMGMLRGAAEMHMTMTNSATGEVVKEETYYTINKSYGGSPAFVEMEVNPYELGLMSNTHYTLTFEAVLDYGNGEKTSETREFGFYVDYETPTVLDASVRYEYDDQDERHAYLDLTFYDNHYLQSLQLFALPTLEDADYLTDYPLPITGSTTRGGSVLVSVEITEYLDVLKNNFAGKDPETGEEVDYRNAIGIRIDDFALNSGAFFIDINPSQVEEAEVTYTYKDGKNTKTEVFADGTSMLLQPGQEVDLREEKNVSVLLADGTKVNSTIGLNLFNHAEYRCTHKDANGKVCGYTYTETEGLTYRKGDYYVDENGKVAKKSATSNETDEKYPAGTLFLDMVATWDDAKGKFVSNGFVCPGCGEEVTFNISRAGKIELQTYKKLTSDPFAEDAVWSTSSSSIVRVKEGKIYAVKEGTATVTVASNVEGNDYSFSFTVKVEGEAFKTYVEGLTVGHYDVLDHEDKVMYSRYPQGGYDSVDCGSTLKLFATYEPWYLTKINDLKWTTSDADTLEILEYEASPVASERWAKVVCKKPGVATVYLMSESYGVNGSFTLIIGEEFDVDSGYFHEYSGAGYTEKYVMNEGTEAEEERKVLVIPANLGIMYLSYYNVSREGPFYQHKGLDIVIVPEGVTAIGVFAFAESTVRTLYLPSSLESIAYSAFAGCESLEEIYWYDASEDSTSNIVYDTDNNTYNDGDLASFFKETSKTTTAKRYAIGNNAFNGCAALTQFDLSRATAIYPNAFTNCASLPNANLGELSYCGKEAFAGCISMTELTLSAKTVLSAYAFAMTNISQLNFKGSFVPAYAFASTYSTYNNQVITKGLTKVTFENDLEYIGEGAFYGNAALTSVTFLGECKVIGAGAFLGCTSLGGTQGKLMLPEGLETIDSYAFGQCSSLKEVVVHADSNIQTVGATVFAECTKLQKISLSDESENYKEIVNGNYTMITNKTGSKVILTPPAYQHAVVDGVFTIPEGVTVIGAQAYAYNASLENAEVVIPEGVTEIGVGAFEGTGIKKVTIPASVKTIAPYAFAGCENLATVVFADGNALEELETGVFNGCTALKSIDLPDTVTVIGMSAFVESGLTAFEVGAKVEYIYPQAFYMCQELQSLTFATPEDAEHELYIMDAAFAGCTKLVTLTLADHVGYVGSYAFSDCWAIKEIYVSKGLFNMGEFAFANTRSLEKVVFGEGAEVIGNYAFMHVTTDQETGEMSMLEQEKLTSVTIPESMQYIGAYAFASATKLEKVDVKAGEIGAYAFAGCTALTEVTLTEKTKYILEGAFTGSGIEKINLNYVEYIGTYAFAETNVTLMNVSLDNVKTIGEGAFINCPNVWALKLPNVEYIYSMAFYYAPTDPNTGASMEETREGVKVEVDLGDKLIGLGAAAFFGWQIKEIELPATFDVYGTPLFAGCFELETITVAEGNEKFFVKNGGLYAHLDSARGGYELVAVPNATNTAARKADKTAIPAPFEIIDGTVRIAPWAMGHCTDIHTVIIPASVTVIGTYAFYNLGYNVWAENMLDVNGDYLEGVDRYDRTYSPHYVFKGLSAPIIEAEFDDEATTIADMYNIFTLPIGYGFADVTLPVNAKGFTALPYTWSFAEFTYTEELIETGTQELKDWISALDVDALTIEDATEVKSMVTAYSTLSAGQKGFLTTEEYQKLSAAAVKINELEKAEADKEPVVKPEKPEKEKKGCNSTMSMAIGFVVLAMASAVLMKKKGE